MHRHKSVLGAVLCVERGNQNIAWLGSVGNIEQNAPYFITSVTKLCVTTLILKLRSENQLQLDDKINRYLDREQFTGLHKLNGIDHSDDINIRHLLGHTSGIPDYLAYKQANGRTADYALNRGIDEAWPLARVLETVRQMKPKFQPGAKGKVHYSNTNYRLLGTIIERITGGTIGSLFQEYLFDPLNLSQTYAYHDIHDNTPVPMYYRAQELHIPRCMASVTAEGGVVSTALDTMALLKAFFCGHFFPTDYLEDLKSWNFSLLPYQVHFGVGIERLWLPRIVTGFKPISEVLGFWGSSGAFAFYHPGADIYFTGTVNQSSGLAHGAAFKAMINILKAVQS